MSSESWPPQLKEWVAKCLGQITDSNRAEVQTELKQVISDAFAAHTLWTTDWAGVQLKSLLPKLPPTLGNLKRKSIENAVPATKKAKKALYKNATAAYTTSDINDQAALNRRAERFQREHELERTKLSRSAGAIKANQHYSYVYGNLSRSGTPYAATGDEPEADPNVIDWDRATIVGTSQEIFKDYLRLTSEPKPETIRPYPILQKTLSELKDKWKAKTPYAWICSQFKSLRQDLTVQRIKNEFTVQVYEIHARMALETGDMVEYNQCQATLKTLYELGIPGKVEEFTAYRILMLLHGRNRSELNLYVGQLTPRQKADPAVQHALEVQRAQSMGNYYKLCDLYNTAPNMGAYIMDHFIDRERVKALMTITKVYKTISLSYLSQTLAFESLEDARTFLADHQVTTFTNPNSPDMEKVIDCKPAYPTLQRIFEEKYRKVAIRGAI
ncbi:SAC3/GANP/Nin1/mts3/eIF-3 p25 family-domain-containing protein [Gymnopilus junonius]|uniref:SAC3/GANP/Nin1/mts3/eIF-3 p25 family-domain-containing protein n=1 Tax=Gymnopilus junonius TaxID=109634 RepID=A0A9P5TMW4_GYMJU|nr:SAC3/GANP/Nin1/mts3/eIF-3 p25 family-domain-containing protein [Gymnopilus junonius]